MVLGWLKRNEKPNSEVKSIITHGILTGDSTRPLSEQEALRDLQINPYLIRSSNLEGTIKTLLKMAGEKNVIDMDLIALGATIDPLIRVSHLTDLDAKIGYLKTRRILRRIEMNSESVEIINLIEALELERFTAWNDAIGGWKAKLTKVSPKTYEITMSEAKQKQSILSR